MLSFFLWDVLAEMFELIEPVPEGFPTYSYQYKNIIFHVFLYTFQDKILTKASISFFHYFEKSYGLYTVCLQLIIQC